MERQANHTRIGGPAAASVALVVLLGAVLLLPAIAAAAEPVGRVVAASGAVTAKRGDASNRSLARGDAIYAGDSVRTNRGARVQLRFTDGGLIDLEPLSRFRVAEYEGSDGDGNVVLEFLRGALRTLTGAIGPDSGERYRMETPVATIGVRGTAYALRYCDSACVEAGSGRQGLYGRVDDGQIRVEHPSGTRAFGSGQYFLVPADGRPRRIVAPPEELLVGGDDGAEGQASVTEDVGLRPLEGEQTDETNVAGPVGGDVLAPRFESGEEIVLGDPRPGSVANVLFGGAVATEEPLSESALLLSPDDGEARLADGDLAGVEFPDNGFLDIEGMTLADSGTFQLGQDAEIAFGRFEGDVALDGDSGSPTSGGFVYASTDPANVTSSSVLADKNNSILYGGLSNSISGPVAVATSGMLWDLQRFEMRVDFQADSATVERFALDRQSDSDFLEISSPTSGAVDDATSSVSVDDMAFNSSDSLASYTGSLRGKFVGDNGEYLIIRYDVGEDSGSNTITGISIIDLAS
jgi:hypothetical protein